MYQSLDRKNQIAKEKADQFHADERLKEQQLIYTRSWKGTNGSGGRLQSNASDYFTMERSKNVRVMQIAHFLTLEEIEMHWREKEVEIKEKKGIFGKSA